MYYIDLTRLHSILQEQYKEWTKWEVYLAELESGVLSWDSMLHTETFLRQHAKRMEDNNFWVIQRLLELLKIHLPKQLQQSLPMTIALPLTLSVVADNNDNDNDNNDESCLDIPAIALLDLGEFAKHYPNGRAVLHKLGAKPIIMAYMEHSNPNIQRQAILCTSKMLLQHHSQHVVVVGTEQK